MLHRPAHPSLSPPATRLYFAYGSNLSTTQMASSCPGATPLHLAWVSGWRFIINQRGVANIVPDAVVNPATGSQNPGVYGILYEIDADDEDSLDVCEGVPHVYEKAEMAVWVRREEEGSDRPSERDFGEEAGTTEERALVYVDTKRTDEGGSRPEYVPRMNRAIEEATQPGPHNRLPLPRGYVEEVMSVLFLLSRVEDDGDSGWFTLSFTASV